MPNWLYRNVEEWLAETAAPGAINVADSLSPTEFALVTVNPLFVVVVDTDIPTESVTVRISLGVQASDALTAAESLTAQILDTPPSFGPSVVDDTILPHDAVAVFLTRQDRDHVAIGMQTAPPPAVGDTITVEELVRLQIGVTPSVIDSDTASELVAVLMRVPVSVFDLTPPAEVVTVSLNLLTVMVNDQAPAGEVALASFGLEVFVLDATPGADAVSLQLGLVVSDDVGPTDAASVQMPVAVGVADIGAPVEQVAGEFNAVLVSVSDATPVTDVANLHRNFIVQVFDTDAVDERRFAAMAKVKKVRVRPGGPA